MSLRKNTLWNIAGSATPLLFAIIFIPHLLKAMGDESFGVLTLIWALVGYFSLFDLGVGRSLTYEISRLVADDNKQEIGQTIKAGIGLTLMTGLLGSVALWTLSPLIVSWLKVSVGNQVDATLAFKICALTIIPTTLTSGFRGVLEGFERFYSSNISKVLIGILTFVLPVISIAIHGVSIAWLASYMLFMRSIVAIMVFLQIFQYIRTETISINKKYFNKLFNYGFWITVTGIVGPLMVYGDRFFVSSIVGAAQLPIYVIPQEGLFRLLIIPAAISNALLPKLAASKGLGFINLYKKSYGMVIKLMSLVCLLVLVSAYPLLGYLISPNFAQQSFFIVLILLIGVFINGISVVPYTLIQADGSPRLTANFHLIELCFYLPTLYFLVNRYSLLGAALAWSLRVALDFFLLKTVANRIVNRDYD